MSLKSGILPPKAVELATMLLSVMLQTLGFEKYRRAINSSPQSMQESDFEHETDLEHEPKMSWWSPVRAPATVRHCRQFRKKILNWRLWPCTVAVGENFGALVSAKEKLIQQRRTVILHPERNKNSSQRKPNHPVYCTPSSSSN